MPTNNDENTTNRDKFDLLIQYINDSPNSLLDQRSNTNPTDLRTFSPFPLATSVYTQKPISYKHPYTLFVPSITPSYTSSKYEFRKYCLFSVNLTFVSNGYA